MKTIKPLSCDTGSDRATYIKAFFDNLNWDKIEELYQKAKRGELG